MTGFFLLLLSFLMSFLPVRLCAREMGQADSIASICRDFDISGMQGIYSHKNRRTTFCFGDGITQKTIFEAASLSKVVFSYVVLRLVDKGILDLDTPLMRYFTNQRFTDPEKAMALTARMVLQHKSGLPNWAVSPSSEQWISSPLAFLYPTGECFSYSGEGFAYLQQTLEHLTGKSLNELATEEVFIPLGMKNTSYQWQDEFARVAAEGYGADGKPIAMSRTKTPNSAYTLLTNAADYELFLSALARGKGLSRASFESMTAFNPPCKRCSTTGISPACRHVVWGLGVGLAGDKSQALWHWGDNGNFKCFFILFPKERKHLVFFTNSRNGLKGLNRILDLYLEDLKQTWQWIPVWLDEHYGI